MPGVPGGFAIVVFEIRTPVLQSVPMIEARADDKKARLVELQKSASELRDPANQARLVEEILKLLEQIHRG